MTRTLRAAALVLALVATCALSGCELLSPTIDYSKTPSVTGSASTSGSDVATSAPHVWKDRVLGTPIDMDGGVAYPGRVYINVDATVTWVNHDSVAHRIWGNDFRSTTIAPGGQYSRRFMTSGTFSWRCMIHPVLGGEIIVQ